MTYPPYAYAQAVNQHGGRVVCQFCGRMMLRGLTVRGKLAWFDVEPDETGGHVNHRITCPEREKAEAEFKRPQATSPASPQPTPESPQRAFDLPGGRIDRDAALDGLEARRASWIKWARYTAARIIQEKGWVTSDDVWKVCPVPDGINHKVMGAVFRPPFRKLGEPVQTERRVAHARPIQRWTLSYADLAQILLEGPR